MVVAADHATVCKISSEHMGIDEHWLTETIMELYRRQHSIHCSKTSSTQSIKKNNYPSSRETSTIPVFVDDSDESSHEKVLDFKLYIAVLYTKISATAVSMRKGENTTRQRMPNPG